MFVFVGLNSAAIDYKANRAHVDAMQVQAFLHHENILVNVVE